MYIQTSIGVELMCTNSQIYFSLTDVVVVGVWLILSTAQTSVLLYLTLPLVWKCSQSAETDQVKYIGFEGIGFTLYICRYQFPKQKCDIQNVRSLRNWKVSSPRD